MIERIYEGNNLFSRRIFMSKYWR